MGPRERKLLEWAEAKTLGATEEQKQYLIDLLRQVAAELASTADAMVDEPSRIGRLAVHEPTMKLCRILVSAETSVRLALHEVRRADAQEN